MCYLIFASICLECFSFVTYYEDTPIRADGWTSVSIGMVFYPTRYIFWTNWSAPNVAKTQFVCNREDLFFNFLTNRTNKCLSSHCGCDSTQEQFVCDRQDLLFISWLDRTVTDCMVCRFTVVTIVIISERYETLSSMSEIGGQCSRFLSWNGRTSTTNCHLLNSTSHWMIFGTGVGCPTSVHCLSWKHFQQRFGKLNAQHPKFISVFQTPSI
jgi:hypothetical protein